MPELPRTQYAKSGDVHIAYQVSGHGPIDLVFVPGFVSHLEYDWEHPLRARFFHRLAAFSRLIRFDKRGTGLSDRGVEMPTLEQRMDDVRAVMDAVGSQRAALIGVSEGGPMSILFAATYPERTAALVIYGSYARRSWAPDYPCGWTDDQWRLGLERLERDWGGSSWGTEIWAPSWPTTRLPEVPRRLHAIGGEPRGGRRGLADEQGHRRPAHPAHGPRAHPGPAPHRRPARPSSSTARYLAERIPGAKLVELPGRDHLPWAGDADAILERDRGVPDRRPARRRARPRAGHGALHRHRRRRPSARPSSATGAGATSSPRHYALVRRELERFRGREIDTAGDGFFAAFDGPARAIRCAPPFATASRSLGLEVRAGSTPASAR